ncbi:MAG TPA: PQQ-binding-like beta-propeller repeat protein [Acidobacteriaceae bacterium]|nr:PQQ-binding-like beta-propeller repeat protein [Acidobacteriaceae bacterium]
MPLRSVGRRLPAGSTGLRLIWLAVLIAAVPLRGFAQSGWPSAGHDESAQRYSPLTQIDVHNVSRLAPAWTFPLKNESNAPDSWPTESVPLVIGGTMYVSWPFCHVAALDADTGRQLWQYTAPRCAYRGPGLSSMRNVAYWPGDKTRAPRIVFGTEDGELYALEAESGKPSLEFGVHGVVDLKTPEIMQGFPHMHYGLTSAPMIYQDLVITGSHLDDETGAKGPSGDVRAWDARSGKLVWTFHTVPRPGEQGHESWIGDGWKKASGADVWSFFTLDRQRGILYMPVGSVNNDHYGADRPGNDLFSDSLVAVDARTGKLKWYFQAIHHDLWDYDMPAAPMLFDVVHDGKRIPAVAAMTKNPLLFILNRVTGKPIYGVEERPVPAGDVPGEWYSPTQPFPVKPPPLSRQGFTEADFARITPEHEAACRQWYAKFLERGGVPGKGPYTPSSANGTLQFPDHRGGAWMWGGAFDPALGYYILNTTDSGGLHFLERAAVAVRAPLYADPDGQSPMLYSYRPKTAQPAGSFAALSFSANGWPCWAPPWGRLTAVDVNTGEIAWQIPYGTMNGVPAGIKTGAPSSQGGPTTTAGGLIFMTGAFDHEIRALATKSGTELWSFKLDQVPLAVPIVYAGKSGREYVAIDAGNTLIAFSLAAAGAREASRSLLAAQAEWPQGDGRELVQRVCTSCHSADVIRARRQTREGWSATVEKMAQSGASATDAEFSTIVDYLTRNFGPEDFSPNAKPKE